MSENPIADLLAEIADLNTKYDAADTDLLRYLSAGLLVESYRKLAKTLEIRAYPIETENDRLEQVVVTVHGLDLSVRGRPSDLFAHVDSGDRDVNDRERFPLSIEVDDTGEVDFGEVG